MNMPRKKKSNNKFRIIKKITIETVLSVYKSKGVLLLASL